MEAERKRVSKNDLAIAAANNHLAAAIYLGLAKKEGNVLFSPLSISAAMAMLIRGTQEDSLKEMRQVLGYNTSGLATECIHESYSDLLNMFDENQDTYILSVANALVSHVDFSMKPEYKEDLKKFYKAYAAEVDFEKDSVNAVRLINEWVKEKTQGKITSIFKSLDPTTVLVLLNGVYFKGLWNDQFNPLYTRNELFYNYRSDEKDVPMMIKTARFPYVYKEEFQVLEMPYKGDDIAMMFVMPNAKYELEDIEKHIQTDFLTNLRKEMREIKVRVILPKLNVNYSSSLKNVFQDLGLHTIFDSSRSNFKGLSDQKLLRISEIMHKAVLEVTEEGCEAAAVTAVVMNVRCVVITPEFRANRPFMFFIFDKRNDIILFMGRIEEL